MRILRIITPVILFILGVALVSYSCYLTGYLVKSIIAVDSLFFGLVGIFGGFYLLLLM